MARTSADRQPEPAPARHGRVTPIAADAGVAANAAFARAGFTDPSLVLRWREIAGPEVARLAQPLKLSDGPSGGTLTLRAVPGAALFLAHEKRALCDRINGYLGRPAITHVKFSQGVLPARANPLPFQKPARPLSPRDPSHNYDGPEGLAKALQALAKRRDS